MLKAGGRVRINSGNLRNPRADEGEWIIDETVYVVREVATGLVRTDPRWAAYRDVLDDAERMAGYLAWRDRVFLAPRPLELYLDALRGAGFAIEEVTERTIEANVAEWYEFLATYADAVLGWVGGSAKVDGRAGGRAGRRGPATTCCASRLTRSSAGARRSAAAGRTSPPRVPEPRSRYGRMCAP